MESSIKHWEIGSSPSVMWSQEVPVGPRDQLQKLDFLFEQILQDEEN